jgi:phage shock protein C
MWENSTQGGDMQNKLYRSDKDRILFGVCGGLAKYFGMDSSLMRIIVILLAIVTGGVGVLIYLAMAFIVPLEGSTKTTPKEIVLENVEEAKTTAQGLGKEIKEAFSQEKAGEKSESREDSDEQARRRNIFGVILIIVGIFILLGVFGIFHWPSWSIVWPIILIIIGVLIILSISRKR